MPGLRRPLPGQDVDPTDPSLEDAGADELVDVVGGRPEGSGLSRREVALTQGDGVQGVHDHTLGVGIRMRSSNFVPLWMDAKGVPNRDGDRAERGDTRD